MAGERIKKRIEALESFREASTTGGPRLVLSDTDSLGSQTSSHGLERNFNRIAASPTTSTPSLDHPGNLEDRSGLSECSTLASSSKSDKDLASSIQPHPEPTPTTSSPSLDTALSFEPYNGDSDLTMWDLECKDASGQTAFHMAAAKGWDSIVQSLFDKGADINAKIKS